MVPAVALPGARASSERRGAGLREKVSELAELEMKLNMIHVHGRDGKYTSGAQIDVDGLGQVSIKNALSLETIKRIEAEAFSALRLKLGQPLQLNDASK